MKVILLTDVKGKGRKGDVVEVAGGFGAHLIRDKKAVEASKGGIKVLENHKLADENKVKEQIATANKNKDVLENKTLEFKLKAGKNGRVFNSVSTKQICDRVFNELDIKLDKRKFIDKESVSILGTTNVRIELHKGVVATIKVSIKEL